MDGGIVATAFIVAIVRAWMVVRWAVDRDLWIGVMRNTLAAGDRAKALKLGNAIESPIGDAMRAAILRAEALQPTDSPAEAEAAIREAHERALQPIGLLDATRPMSLLALLLAAYAFWRGTQANALSVVHAFALLVIPLALWSELRVNAVLATGPAGLEAVLPYLVPRPRREDG